MFFYRVLKILGCNYGCHESLRPPGGVGGVGVQVPISNVETLRNRGVALLSRLLWYDKKQFKQFLAMMADNRDLSFLGENFFRKIHTRSLSYKKRFWELV